MGTRAKYLTNYIFQKRLNYPSLISSPLPPRKLNHKSHTWNKLTENNTLPPNNFLQKLHIQMSDVPGTKPEHIINKKNYDFNIYKKEINMCFKYLWISAPELQSWTTICCRRQEGPWNGCVSQAWFMIGYSLKLSPFRAWVLFDFSGLFLLRERKKEGKKYRARDGIWEKMKERKKKNCSETEGEETFTTEDQDFPPLLWCSS